MPDKKKKRPIWKTIIRVLLKFLVAVFGLLIIFTLLLNIPAVQTYLTSHISNYLEKKLETVVEVEAVKIALPKTVVLEGFYIEDQNEDTLIYLGSLHVNIRIFELLANKVNVKYIQIENLVSGVHRKAPEHEFNFQFIIDAFASPDTSLATEPETESKPWDLSLGEVHLEQINANYYDDVVGIDALIQLGELSIDVDELDPVNMVFMLENLAMKNTVGSVEMWEVELSGDIEETKSDPDSESKANFLPELGLENLIFENLNLKFKHREWQYDFNADIEKLELETEKVDLNKQLIKVNSLLFENSNLLAAMPLSSSQADTLAVIVSTAKQSSVFPPEIPYPFPDWDISVNEVQLSKINAELNDVNSVPNLEALDFVNLKVNDLNLEMEDAAISPVDAKAKINKLSFREQSGFGLNNFSVDVSASDKAVTIEGLKMETINSSLSFDASVEMASINSLLLDPANTRIHLDMKKSTIGMKDVLLLMPSLAENESFSKIRDLKPIAQINTSGTLEDLQLILAELQLSESTGIRLKGNVKNILDFDNLNFDLNLDTLYTTRNDLYKLLDSSVFQGYQLPGQLGFSALAAGAPDSLSARLNAFTSTGDFFVKGYFYNPEHTKRDTFSLKLDLVEFNLDEYIADTTFGLVNLNLEAGGTGVLTDSISADLRANILQPLYNGYEYEDLLLTASMRNLDFELKLKSPDPNAMLRLNAIADLSKEKYNLNLDLDVDVFNLYALNFSSDKTAFKTRLAVSANYHNLDDLEAKVGFSHFEIAQENDILTFDSASLATRLTPDSTLLRVRSAPLNIDLESNISSIELEPVLRSAALKYLGLNDSVGLPPGKKLRFDVNFSMDEKAQLPLFPEIKKLATDKFSGEYTSDNNHLSINLDVPLLVYNNIAVDSIKVAANGLEENASFQVGFTRMAVDSIIMDPFLAMAEIKKGEVFSRVQFGANPDSLTFLVSSQLEIEDEALKISLLPDGLIFDHNKWQVPDGNFLKITRDSFFSRDFNFGFKEQQLGVEINDQLADLYFDDFELANLSSFLNYENFDKLVKGSLDGKLSLPAKVNQHHLIADLQLDNLHLIDTHVGKIAIQADQFQGLLNLDIDFDNPLNKMNLAGSIDQTEEVYNLKCTIDFADISRLERFTFGEISQMSGKINGDVQLNGTYDDPRLQGFIKFKDARLNVTQLNFQTNLKNESLRFDNKGIHFDEFNITDVRNKELDINGSIYTKDYNDFAFDLQIKADDFQPVNSTSKDNPVFYGNLIIGTDIKIKGDMDLPRIDGILKINKGTDLTYALPGSEIELITPEGTVNFIDPDQSLDTLFNRQTGDFLTDSIMSKFQGIDLSANLRLDPQAKFTVFIDPTSGDYLTISGKANLNFTADPSGNQTVTGIFEVSEGLYQLSFYGLVKKSFTIKPGSTVAWSGRPMDANLNLTAMHIVRTASTALVANESASLSQAEVNMFKTRLPYQVLLNIRGFLSEPKVSFNINLEDKYMVNYPMVASKLARLNTPEMQSELNKQVFALLVAGTFIADNPLSSTSSASDNIATTAARNSVNGILADQLNNISNRYIKSVNLDFGLTTYDDYSSGSGESRTELDVRVSKKFMNDRLEVEASGTFDLEGNEKKYTNATSQNMYGEFSVIYGLTEEGDYKVRAFRENAYDIFDGEVAYSGVAFILEKSFNSLKDFIKNNKLKKKESREEKGLKEAPAPENGNE